MKDLAATLDRIGFRGRNALIKIAVIVVIEVIVSVGYLEHEAPDHYILHPLIALNSVLPVLIALRVYDVRTREEILFCYAFLNFARFPDYLFQAGIDHQGWMNIFLLHLAFDDIIGYAIPFLGVIVLILLAAYIGLKVDPQFASEGRQVDEA